MKQAATMMLRAVAIACICLVTASGPPRAYGTGGAYQPPAPPIKEASAWAATHAIPLTTCEPGAGSSDLQPLTKIIGISSIVAFGEAKHEVHEFLALRNRLFEFLVERMGFTALAAETGYSESLIADDYVLGRDVDPGKAASAVFSWSVVRSQENAQLLDWMRSYNHLSHTRRPVRFYGMDLTGGRNGTFPEARLAFDGALHYLARVDRQYAMSLHRVLDPLLDRFNTSGYSTLSEMERNQVSSALDEMLGAFERGQTEYVALSSTDEYQRAYRNAIVARELEMNFRAQTRMDPQPGRDVSMAQNLKWIVEREGPGGRVFVFAHNAHVRRPPKKRGLTQGQYLLDFPQTRTVVIGSLFLQAGEAKQRVENEANLSSPLLTLKTALWTGARKPLFLLDFGALPPKGPLVDWLTNSAVWESELNPAEAFDALILVDDISPRRQLE